LRSVPSTAATWPWGSERLMTTASCDISVALEKLGPMADKVQPLFITVDPERDTPKVTADYERTAAVTQAYHIYYEVRKLGNNNEYAVDHSSFIYVVNPQGEFVKLITGDLPGHPMADELRQLIR
jgi:protein SCO1